jgi:hypothetical protein
MLMMRNSEHTIREGKAIEKCESLVLTVGETSKTGSKEGPQTFFVSVTIASLS